MKKILVVLFWMCLPSACAGTNAFRNARGADGTAYSVIPTNSTDRSPLKASPLKPGDKLVVE